MVFPDTEALDWVKLPIASPSTLPVELVVSVPFNVEDVTLEGGSASFVFVSFVEVRLEETSDASSSTLSSEEEGAAVSSVFTPANAIPTVGACVSIISLSPEATGAAAGSKESGDGSSSVTNPPLKDMPIPPTTSSGGGSSSVTNPPLKDIPMPPPTSSSTARLGAVGETDGKAV